MPSPIDKHVEGKLNGCSEESLMDNKLIRLSTFGEYPSNNISAIKLVADGFYFPGGRRDTVACFECKCRETGFTDTDDINDIHNLTCSFKKAPPPNQPLVEPADRNNNPTAGAEATALPPATPPAPPPATPPVIPPAKPPVLSAIPAAVLPPPIDRSLDFIGTTSDPQDVGEMYIPTPNQPTVIRFADVERAVVELMAIHTMDRRNWRQEPMYDNMTSEISRRNSYIRWSCAVGSTPTTNWMANAGFYHTGRGDSTACFHCGIRLSNWLFTDDPWIEHARWAPSCMFLLNEMGSRFIAIVQSTIKHSHVNLTSPEICTVLTENTGYSSVYIPSCDLDIREHPAVEPVIEMGYREVRVISAYNTLKEHKHFREITADDVVNTILNTPEPPRLRPLLQSRVPPRATSQENKLSKTEKRLINEDKVAALETILNDNSSTFLSQVQKQYTELKRRIICKICKKEDACFVFLPCAHLCACNMCYSQTKPSKCPLCGVNCTKVIKA